jgi:hypothetical protein
MSEQETDMAKDWFQNGLLVYYSAGELATLTPELQRSVMITFDILLAACQIQIQMENSV